jgi:hypothetical protein
MSWFWLRLTRNIWRSEPNFARLGGEGGARARKPIKPELFSENRDDWNPYSWDLILTSKFPSKRKPPVFVQFFSLCMPLLSNTQFNRIKIQLMLLLIQCTLKHLSFSPFPNSLPGVECACTRRAKEYFLETHRNKCYSSSPVTSVVPLTIPLFVYGFQRVNSDDYCDIN